MVTVDVRVQAVPECDPAQEVDVSKDEVALGRDREAQAAGLGHHLEKASGHAVAPLGRLIRIGGGSKGDTLPFRRPAISSRASVRAASFFT